MSNKKLAMFVGASGSGKDYHASQFYHNYIYVNADVMREIIGKDESDQEVNYPVFQTLERMTEYFMKQELPIAIVNTNYNKKNRKKWVELGKKYGYQINAIVMKTLFDECVIRNEKRIRKVPVEIIRKQFDGFEEPTKEEGFDNISYV